MTIRGMSATGTLVQFDGVQPRLRFTLKNLDLFALQFVPRSVSGRDQLRMNFNRRELITLGLPALAGIALAPGNAGAAGSPLPAAFPTGTAWAVKRQKIERAWLDLLGDFPAEIPPLKPVMKEVAHEGGITRYHVSFQAEPDDRVTAWLLVPDSAKDKRTPAIVNIHSTTWAQAKTAPLDLRAGARRIRRPHPKSAGRADWNWPGMGMSPFASTCSPMVNASSPESG